MDSILTVYKASAGSGKTFTLTVEYILLLVSCPDDREYAHTLSVTFTNKATSEMKDRILQQLYGLSRGLSSSQGYLWKIRERLADQGIAISDEDIRLRCAKSLTQILHDYHHFRVETIDSFFQSVLRDLARELGLNANLQVELDNSEVVSRAVDRIIENLQMEPQLQKWILSYVGEQIEENGKWDITRSVKDFARCIFVEEFQNRPITERQNLSDEKSVCAFRDKMKEMEASHMKLIRDEVSRLEERITSQALNFSVIKNGNTYQTYLRNVSQCILFEPTKRVLDAMEDPMALLKKTDIQNAMLVAQAKDTSAALCDLHKLYVDSVTLIHSSRLARQYINPMRLLGAIEEQANIINQEKNQFNLSMTPTLLSTLIDKSDAPFIFEKSGTTFRNVMIDEFQDTSALQWNNFRVLLMENQANGGKDLLVGDVKQSIYRWRNGDWGILHHIGEEMKRMNPKMPILNTNYRSERNIILFNNHFFTHAANEMDRVSDGSRFSIADIYQDVEQKSAKNEEKGFVRIRLYRYRGNSKPESYEERMVTDMIAQIHSLMSQGLSLNQMAILVRTNKNGTRLIRLFQDMAPDIPLVSDEAFLLRSSIAVQMLIQALRVLADVNGDNRVPLFSLALDYQQKVLGTPIGEEQLFLSDAMAYLPEEFVHHIERLRMRPLYILCEELYRIFSLCNISGQQAYMCAFYDNLQQYLLDNPSDIRSFLVYWDEKMCSTAIPAAEVSGVRILTIHKSKGLEFHTIFAPFTDWSIERDDGMLWCQTEQQPFSELGVLPISMGKEMRQSVFSPFYEEEHLQSRVDGINLLYVAFTRPCCNLYVWGSTHGDYKVGGTSGDLIHKTLDMKPDVDGGDEETYFMGQPVSEYHTRGEESDNRLSPVQAELPVSIHASVPRMDFRQSNESVKFVRDLGLEEGEERSQSYLEIGKVLHYVLSQIRHEGDVERVLLRCQSQGLVIDSHIRETVLRRIHYGMQNSRVKDWFSPDKTVYNECSITFISPDTGEPVVRRPDRVVMTSDTITVIDFKFGNPKPEYDTQVAEYMQLLQSMYPQYHVEGFLWYIYSGKVMPVNPHFNFQ